MKFYALLFKGGKNHSELTKEYFERFMRWATKVAIKEIPGQRFKQEGRIVSADRVDPLIFDEHTVGGYIVIEAENYDGAVHIAKECPILENNGTVEVRELIIENV